MDQNTQKKAAAEAALKYVIENEFIGIGTGSTVNFFIAALIASRIPVKGAVSSSEASSKLLRAGGIEVITLNDAGPLALYVDGADEVTRDLAMIKGGGAALTREKIVAAASETFVCLADASKLVTTLGGFPLPIEVIPMARSYVAREIVKLGGAPEWRVKTDGAQVVPVVTDNGNAILDVHGLRITEPFALETALNQIAGVVCNGIFANRGADILLLATPDGVEVISRTGG